MSRKDGSLLTCLRSTRTGYLRSKPVDWEVKYQNLRKEYENLLRWTMKLEAGLIVLSVFSVALLATIASGHIHAY